MTLKNLFVNDSSLYYTLHQQSCGGYTSFNMAVCPSVCLWKCYFCMITLIAFWHTMMILHVTHVLTMTRGGSLLNFISKGQRSRSNLDFNFVPFRHYNFFFFWHKIIILTMTQYWGQNIQIYFTKVKKSLNLFRWGYLSSWCCVGGHII